MRETLPSKIRGQECCETRVLPVPLIIHLQAKQEKAENFSEGWRIEKELHLEGALRLFLFLP